MKTGRTLTFVALTGMFFAVLTIFHADLFYINALGLPWYVMVGGVRLILACLLSLGLTVILFHLKG